MKHPKKFLLNRGKIVENEYSRGVICGYNRKNNLLIIGVKEVFQMNKTNYPNIWKMLKDVDVYIEGLDMFEFLGFYYLINEKGLVETKPTFTDELKGYSIVILTLVTGFITYFFGPFILNVLIENFPKGIVELIIVISIVIYGILVYLLWPKGYN